MKRILIGIIIAFLLLLLAAIIVPIFFESQLNTRLKSEINNRLIAQVEYKNFSLSLIRSFPNVTFSLHDISITGRYEFKDDTLILIKHLSLSIDLRSVIKGSQYQILAINFIEPTIYNIVNSDGKANWNILKTPSGGGEAVKPSLFSIHVAEYGVLDGEVSYIDKRNGSSAQIHHLDLEGSGNVVNEVCEVSLRTKAFEFRFRNDSTAQQSISGSLNLALNFKASKIDVEQKNYEAFHFSGKVNILNLECANPEIYSPITIANSQIAFTEKNIVVASLNATIGKSDISLTGALNNYIPYSLNKGDLAGNLAAHSNVFDVNEWLKKDTEQTKTTASTNKPMTSTEPQYLKVPAHIDLTINSQFDRIYSDKLNIENLKGHLLIRDEAVNLNNVTGNLLGGSATLSGRYDTKNSDHPAINFSYSIIKMDIQQAFNSIKAIGLVGPGIKYVSGNCFGDIAGSGKLKPDMSIDYNSIAGSGKIFMPDTKISEMPVLDEIYKVTKIPSLKNLEVKNVQTSFTFKNGRVNMAPTDLKFTNGYSMNLQGSGGFDQTVDYDMKLEIPAKQVVSSSPIAQGILSFLPGLATKLPETMDFTFKISGNAAKPQVKLINMAPVNPKK